MPTFAYDEAVPFVNIMAPTPETAMQRFLFEKLHAQRSPHTVLWRNGGRGVRGHPTVLSTSGDSFVVAGANFSAQTSSPDVVDFMEASFLCAVNLLRHRAWRQLPGSFRDTVTVAFAGGPPVSCCNRVRPYLQAHGLPFFWPSAKRVSPVVVGSPARRGVSLMTVLPPRFPCACGASNVSSTYPGTCGPRVT